MSIESSEDTERYALANILSEADARWQHGIGAGGYDIESGGYFLMLADALVANGAEVVQ